MDRVLHDLIFIEKMLPEDSHENLASVKLLMKKPAKTFAT